MFTSIKNTKKGFTLIELLVVIAIIGILSSVVLASLSTARQKSRDSKRIADLGQIQLALELFFDANQGYPRSNALTCTTPTTCTIAASAAGLSPLYMPRIPTPPSGTLLTNYIYIGITAAGVYNSAASSTHYVIAAQLERTDNPILATDANSVVVASGALLTGFTGNVAACTTGGAAATNDCYDIKP